MLLIGNGGPTLGRAADTKRGPSCVARASTLAPFWAERNPVFVFANNHYARHAPATVELFRELWKQKTEQDLGIESVTRSGRLFS